MRACRQSGEVVRDTQWDLNLAKDDLAASAGEVPWHQVPPQPLQSPLLWLQYPDAQLPLQLFDHLQHFGAGAGVG